MSRFQEARSPALRIPSVFGGDAETRSQAIAREASPQPQANDAPEPAQAEPNKVAPEKPDPAEQAKQAGYDAGYEAGHAQGYNAGYDEALAAAQEQISADRAEAQRTVETLTDTLAQPLLRLKGDLAAHVTDGAIQLAEAILDTQLNADGEALRGTVEEILAEASDAADSKDQLIIRVAPSALDNVRQYLPDNAMAPAIELRADESLEDGDVVATMASADDDPVHRIEWDARMENRWEAIRDALKGTQQ